MLLMSNPTTADLAQHLPVLRRYARALVREAGAADDLVQQALLRACEGMSTYRPERPLGPWLIAIVHNEFVSGRRRELSAARKGEALVGFDEQQTSGRDQEHAVYLKQVLKQFDALPDGQREVLHLVAVEGLSYAEVASTLDLPIGTVMSRLSRARASLRSDEAPGRTDHRSIKLVGGTDAL